MHVQALEHIESGNPHVAQAELETLSKLAPDYLPALLERALLHQRAGEKTLAATLMREVLRRAEALLPEEIVEGPEPLPARFYRDAAMTMLRGAGPSSTSPHPRDLSPTHPAVTRMTLRLSHSRQIARWNPFTFEL